MPIHLHREIEELKKKVLHLATVVEENVFEAVKSIEERDVKLAKKVIEEDIEIDNMEVEIEEDCLKILALNQPVAIDLRFIVSILKLNNDLERVGDLAVNIAERAIYLANIPPIEHFFAYREMANKARNMFRRSLDSLVNMNVHVALEVCASDDEVDEMERQIVVQAIEGIKKNPELADEFLHHIFIAKHLERIADHATNIAEDVIYMVRGDIIRHEPTDFREPKPQE